jgi:Na+/melibiose symporter-like transporter
VADQLRPDDGPLRLALFGTLVLATAIPGLILTLSAAPDIAVPVIRERFDLGASLRAVFANPLLLRVLASDVAVTAGQGIRTGLLLFVVTIYFGRPEWAAGLFLFQYSFGVLAGPIWRRIGTSLGKGRAAVLAELVQAAINLGLVFLTPDRFGLLLVLALLQGLSQGSGNLMLRSMVADIADKHRAETGEDRVGLYYSVFSVSQKLGAAIAIGIALPLVAAFGFDPRAAVNTPQALQGLVLVFAVGPALAHAIAAALVAGFPLDSTRHSQIRHQLRARDAVYAAAVAGPAE